LLTIGFTGIGIIDDWSKIHRGRSLGLRAREKLGLQLLLAAGFVAVLLLVLHQDTTVGVPFIGLLQLGWWYWPLAILFVAGMSNAVNLTDGLDGLAAGTSTVTAGALASIAWLAPTGSLYCGQLVAAFAVCLGGGCLGFLYHNRPTATVFMGDTGSLAIGAALAGIALALKLEVIFLLAGLIYLIEIGSVMLQVTYFKFTKGRRIFLMSPYHHHLEKRGWSERSIVYRAWVFSLVLAAAAVWLARWTR